MNSQEDVVLIILAIKKSFQPKRTELGIELLDLSLKLLSKVLIILSLIKLYKLLSLVDLINKLLPGIVTIFQGIQILESLLSFLWIIPEIRS